MEHMQNQIQLRGYLHSRPEYSHENHEKKFFRFFLEVPRLSGVSDILPVIAEKPLLDCVDVSEGTMLYVTGQVRSHNVKTEGKRHLLIFVFAYTLACDSGEATNFCTLWGPVCRDPHYRRTPLGREICDVMLAVPRFFKRADYIPCIFWGRTALEASRCQIRDQIQLNGRLQSRVYTKQTEQGPEERVAYEISVLTATFSQPGENIPID